MAEAAPNEKANEKAKKKFNYEVEVLSKEIISEEYVDGVKITKFKHTVKQTDFPTLEEYKTMNKSYFDSLPTKVGVAEAKSIQDKTIADFSEKLANTPEVYEIETTKIGSHSITFEDVTRDWPSTWGTQKDPINIVFYNNADWTTVDSIILSDDYHDWNLGSGGSQWTFIDETAHGGSTYWAFGYGYEEGDYNTVRYHLRLFDGGADTHSGGFGTWSIGAVHKETHNGLGHTLVSNSWEIAENHLGGDLANTSGIGVVSSINIGNSGDYQGINNSGYAALIEVQ